MAIRTELTTAPIPMKSSAWYKAILKDRNGTVVGASALTSLTLTYYCLDAALTIINSRNAQNVLNANGVTLDSSGNLEWAKTTLDTIMVTSGGYEDHVALFEWVGATVGSGKHEVVFQIDRLAKVA
jgi:hypothetical protein